MPEKETVKKVSVDVSQLWKVAKKFFIGYKIEILSLIVIAAVVVFTSSLASQKVVTQQKAAEQCECRTTCESGETPRGMCGEYMSNCCRTDECASPEDCEASGRCNVSCYGSPRQCHWVACPQPTVPPVPDECASPDDCGDPSRCSCSGRPRKCQCTGPAPTSSRTCKDEPECSCVGGVWSGIGCPCSGTCASPTSTPDPRKIGCEAHPDCQRVGSVWCGNGCPCKDPNCDNYTSTPTPINGRQPAACNGRTGSICGHGDSNNDGLVTVLNCTGQTQKYVCQENQEDLQTKKNCDDASPQTNQWKGYRDFWVENGQTGTCSVSPSACGRAQADINLGNTNAICWENTKNCSECSQVTPTSAPTSTPTPVPIACPVLNVACAADGAVQLAWNKIENTAGYRVLRKLAEGQTHQHSWYTTDKNVVAYKDTAVTCNQGYSYLVETFSQSGWVGSWPWPGERSCMPTPVTCNCPSCARIEVLQTTGRPLTDLNSLPAGEVIAVKVISDGVANYVEDYGVRILRNGLEVKNENAGRAGLSEWTSSTYTLQSGTYEIYGYLKVKGQWK